MTRKNLLDDFSAGYFILRKDLEFIEYDDKRAHLPADLYTGLVYETGHEPLVVKVGTEHYEVTPDASMPGNSITLPDTDFGREVPPVLVYRH